MAEHSLVIATINGNDITLEELNAFLLLTFLVVRAIRHMDKTA